MPTIGAVSETYIYGVVDQLGERTVLFAPEDYARAHLAEIEAWRAVTTWGQALDLAHTDLQTAAPIAVEDLVEYTAEHEPDERFRADDTGAAQDGDWPSSIQSLMLDVIAVVEDETGMSVGRQVEAFPSNPWLEIDPSEERALVTLLERVGYTVRRDDDLAQRLAAQ